MSKLPSSKQIINTLLDHNFNFISQRGSHRKYRKENKTVIVPFPKKEIPIGSAISTNFKFKLKIF